jgi:hypothetical protein
MSKAVKFFALLACLLLAGAACAEQPSCSITATNIAFGPYNASSSTAQIGTIIPELRSRQQFLATEAR